MNIEIAELKKFYVYLLQKNLSIKNNFLHTEAGNMLISLKMAILLEENSVKGFNLTNPDEAIAEYIRHIVRVFIVETHFIVEHRILSILSKPKGKIENQLESLLENATAQTKKEWKDFFESFRNLRNCAHNNFICRKAFIWKTRRLVKDKPVAISFNEDVKFLLEKLNEFLVLVDN